MKRERDLMRRKAIVKYLEAAMIRIWDVPWSDLREADLAL